MGRVEWLRPVIDVILAPFKAIGNVVGGIVGAVKGWFGETVDMGKAALEEIAASKKAVSDAQAQAVDTTQTIGIMPKFDMSNYKLDGDVVKSPVTAKTGTASGGSSALLAERLAAASRKGISGAVSSAASDAFMSAGSAALPALQTVSAQSPATATATVVDLPALRQETQSVFPAAAQTSSIQSPAATAVPSFDLFTLQQETQNVFPEAAARAQTAPPQTPRSSPETKNEKRERPHFMIQNLTLHCGDMKNMFDFYQMLETAFLKPEAAAV
jgi:hypothetical protein